jgi:hypothetical protein
MPGRAAGQVHDGREDAPVQHMSHDELSKILDEVRERVQSGLSPGGAVRYHALDDTTYAVAVNYKTGDEKDPIRMVE